jgi:Golgi SNAP receptor complex protein 1
VRSSSLFLCTAVDSAFPQTSLRDAEQRANLLGSVREEIRFVVLFSCLFSSRMLTFSARSAFKTATGSSVTDHLLAERGRIDNSHRMADETLKCDYFICLPVSSSSN